MIVFFYDRSMTDVMLHTNGVTWETSSESVLCMESLYKQQDWMKDTYHYKNYTVLPGELLFNPEQLEELATELEGV